MSELMNLIAEFQRPCSCGFAHTTAIQDIRIASGLVQQVGQILTENQFPKSILLVADHNTLQAAQGIAESLGDFTVEYKIWDQIRVAQLFHVEDLEALVAGREIGILSVGTGSVNDPCRLAAARQQKKLCIFATAPSMDGFASDTAPIVHNGFKLSYSAKSPEVIIGDTRILANAPTALKSAGFGDMVAKYVGLIDWKISALLTEECYCERVAALTRSAIDELLNMADKVTVPDEYTAGKIFEALLKTGIAMSFMKNSRPASGGEHIISHLMECIELRDGIVPNYHGDDVGVCTLEVLKYYQRLAALPALQTHRETADWEDIYSFYGNMADTIRPFHTPSTITDKISPDQLRTAWPDICDIIRSVPSYEVCKTAMERAHCKITVADIGKSPALFRNCFFYSPYMRNRLTLLRLLPMMENLPPVFD